MKKILAMMALAISLPTMAQSMYDGKTCEQWKNEFEVEVATLKGCLLYTSPSPRDKRQSRMPSSA